MRRDPDNFEGGSSQLLMQMVLCKLAVEASCSCCPSMCEMLGSCSLGALQKAVKLRREIDQDSIFFMRPLTGFSFRKGTMP